MFGWSRRRAAALAGAILLTISLPIAIDQGYFRYSPYVLPCLSLVAVALYLGLFVTSFWVKSKLNWTIQKFPIIVSFFIFLTFAGVVGVLSWSGFTLFLTSSKAHIASLRQNEPKTNDSPLPSQSAAPNLTGIQQSLDEINKNLSRKGQSTVSKAQMDEIREVDQFIVGRDEMALRQVFGFPYMLDINIQLNTEAIRHVRSGTPFDFQHYQKGREMIGDTALAEGHTHSAGGLFGYDPSFGTRVLLLVLPTEYSAGKKQLLKFETSSELPNSIIKAVTELDAAASENAKKLLYVLDDALRKDPNYYLLHDDLGSTQFVHQIDHRWNMAFIPLRPKADDIRMAIRQFLRVQQPPNVIANMPPPQTQRAIMELAGDANSPGIKIGRDPTHPELGWGVNVSCMNVGTVVARKVKCSSFSTRIPANGGIPSKQTLEEYWRIASKVMETKMSESLSVDLNYGETKWGTILLQMKDIDPELNSGSKVIFVTEVIVYSDDAGPHRKEYCKWAQSPFEPLNPVWHYCEIRHNKEVY